MNTLFAIGKQIRQARQSAGWTAVALAQECSIGRNTLLRLESGQGNVELNNLLAICDKLNLAIQLIPDDVAMIPRPEQLSASPLARRISERLGGRQSVRRKDIK